jgi:hypothetical protein
VSHQTFPKPARGTALLARRTKRRELVAHEQKEMRAAKKRDEGKCRRPRCPYAKDKLTIHAAHMVHRGMGGDPTGTRSSRETIISLCAIHHGMYDASDLWITPLTAQDFDGPCEYFERNPETGQYDHIATETRIGVSVVRQ